MTGTLHTFFRKVPKEQLKTPAPVKADPIDLTEQGSQSESLAGVQKRLGHFDHHPLSALHAPTSAAALSPSEPLVKQGGEEEVQTTAKRPRQIGSAETQRLADCFAKEPNPSIQHCRALASELGVSEEDVAAWFSSKRKSSEQADSSSKTTMQPLNDATNTHTSQPSTSSARSQTATTTTAPEEPEVSDPPADAPSTSQQPPAKRQKTETVDLVLTAEERQALGVQYTSEADALRSALATPWLREHAPDVLALATSTTAARKAINKAEVACLVEGRHEPLSQLCKSLWSELNTLPKPPAEAAAGTSVEAHAPAISQQAVRDAIIDVATRNPATAPVAGDLDALEDAGGPARWRWEVRELKVVPKQARDFVELERKRRKQLKDRLAKVEEVSRLLVAPATGKAHANKISRAMAKAEKAGGLEAVEGACQEALSALFTKYCMQKELQVQKEASRKGKEEQRRAAEEAKKQAEEVRRKEAEAKKQELEQQRLEKAALKEKQRAEREAEKAQKREQEEARQVGFGSKTSLAKSRGLFKSFFKAVPKAADPQVSAPAMATTPPAPKDPSRQQLFDCPPICRSAQSVEQQQQLNAVIAAGQQPAATVAAEFESIKASWRTQRTRVRQPGLPPTWARKPGATTDFAAMVEKYYGEGAEVGAVRTWRRKLLQHARCQRPAYYGSCSRISAEVSGRRPLAHDQELDYEVESDEDWEDEPEGESLSDDDGGDEEGKAEEDEEVDDGFVVDDGYLSEDEGIRDEEDPMDVDHDEEGGPPLPAATAATAAATSGAGAPTPTDPRIQQLEAIMERARRSHRPLILAAHPSIQTPPPPSSLDPTALYALQAVILGPPGAVIIPPPEEPTEGEQPREGAGAGTAQDRAASGKARPSVALAREVIEELVELLKTTPERSLDKVVAAFINVGPTPRPLAKTRVRDAVRALATYSCKAGRWVLNPASPLLQDTAAPNSPPTGAASSPTLSAQPTPAQPANPTPKHSPALTHPQPTTTPTPSTTPTTNPAPATKSPPTSTPPAALASTPPTRAPTPNTTHAPHSTKPSAPPKSAGIQRFFSTSKPPAAPRSHTTTPPTSVSAAAAVPAAAAPALGAQAAEAGATAGSGAAVAEAAAGAAAGPVRQEGGEGSGGAPRAGLQV